MTISRARATILFWILFLGFVGVLARAVLFQLHPDSRLKEFVSNKSEWNQRRSKEVLLKSRGSIFDRRGNELALSLISKSFYANPRLIENPRSLAYKIGRTLSMPPAKVEELLKSDRYFVWLKREVDHETARKLEALDLRGVSSSKESKRVYPHGELAKTILGLSGRDGVGLEGVEKFYDEWLQAADKADELGVRDALGRVLLFKDFERQWFDGHNLILTVDLRLQKILEEELRQSLASNGALGAQAIMMDPQTGAILAMASIDGNRDEKPNFRNRSISDVYEPGSVFKVMAALAALDKLHLSAKSQIYAENGTLKVGRHSVREFGRRKFEWLTLQEMLAVSSNVAAAKLGLQVGAKNLGEIIDRLGFGSLTGIDLPGEARGLVRPYKDWKPIDLANISFGQGIAVTPLQMTRALAAIANGGFLVKPYVVDRIENSNGGRETVMATTPQKREVFRAELSRQLTDMLISVTAPGGTGAQAAIPGFLVAGKTGTSQKLVDELQGSKTVRVYSESHSIVSFGGYVPAYDPAFVMLVLYDDPKGDATGGATAAPSFRRIASRSLGILGIRPQATIPEARAIVQEPDHVFVGKSFREVLEEIRSWDESRRSKVELFGYGRAVREEFRDDTIQIFFE